VEHIDFRKAFIHHSIKTDGLTPAINEPRMLLSANLVFLFCLSLNLVDYHAPTVPGK